VLEWRAFLARLGGRTHSFRLPATEGPQYGGPLTPYVFGDSQDAGLLSLVSAGWPVWDGTFPKPGQMITVRDQLLVLTAVDGGSDVRLLTFEGRLRQYAGHGVPIEVVKPTALVALSSSSSGWSVGRGTIYGISLAAEERF
jgi:hypothetical protein